MLSIRLGASALVVALVTTISAATPVRAATTPLIPRDVLFGNPDKTSPQISPDGTQIAYLAPSHGVLAVWVRSVGKDDAHVVAADPKRPIRNNFWSPDGSRVLYLQDRGGDENFHIFAVAPSGGASTDLTPYPGVRAGVDAIDYDHPKTILAQMNKRDPKVFDVYRLDPTTGEATLDTQNPGNVAGWVADGNLVVRAGLVANADASYDVIVRDSATAPWRTLVSNSSDDGAPGPLAFTPDGKGLYIITSAGANAARLMRFDVASGAATVVMADPNYDISNVAISAKSKALIAAAVDGDRSTWTVVDKSYQADFDALHAANVGDFVIDGSDKNDTTWIVGYVRDDASPSYWSYDRRTKQATKLFDTRPDLANYTLAKMTPIAFAAGDGLTIHGYLTTPTGVDAKNLPMVLFVHGGPWARDSWGYSGYPQWLANRGYAVLQVNYRGSTGYGKNFLNAGDRQWAGTMRTDLLDAKAWAIKTGVADPKRVAIMGGSYGGYATLAAVTFTPDAFACGVDIVGPSNLNTLLASIPPYWETGRAQFKRRMGDSVDFLNSQSPLFKADAIRVPLLIGQGANDPRVNIRESTQIVDAMRKKSLPVTYVVFPDEGHGFARPENSKRFNAETEAFLAKHLGGRMEPAASSEAIAAFLK